MGAGEARMRFEVLGPLRVLCGDRELSVAGSKPRALLGTLLLHPGAPVGIDELTEALWDGEPPPSATANLRSYVRTLREALGANGERRLQTRAPGYLIRVEPGELDLVEFDDLEARGRQALERGETEVAARRWREALDLWRGAALADIRGGPRLAAEVLRLQERRLGVAEAWIDTRLAMGAHAELVSELRGLVATEPLREGLWARLMVALYRGGRAADALAAFGQAREHLIELGLEPGHQLQRIQRAILAGDAVVDVDRAPRDGRAPAHRASPPTEVCPYRGLMPFEADDAAWYFGRERLVAELITYLASQLTPPSLVAVVGPSGSGKSSLLRAGLLPALADGAIPAARGWPAVVLTPGPQPMVALRDAVAGIRPPGKQAAQPEDLTDPRRFVEAIRDALGPGAGGRRLVMVVDQFEELFALCRDEHQRQTFITALYVAAGGGRPRDDGAAAPALVVLGLRADFYGHCIGYPELIPTLSGGQVVVGPMTAVELRHAIERPAARAGLTLEPGLVDMLLADIGFDPEVGGRPEPGGLPLLSHALLATWQARNGQRLTVDGYRKAGGIHGAIAATAEEVYERLGPNERTVVRQLFTRLVAFGDATQDTGRRIDRDELLAGRSAADADIIDGVLDALARARLIVLGSHTIQVAHEALITRWPRLQDWLTDDREGLRIHRQLTEAAHAWVALGRDPGALYRGARLAVARQWAGRAGHADDMNARERAFLDASVKLEAAEGVAERRGATRLRQLVSAVLALVLVAAAGAAFALWQAQRNTALERANRSRALAGTALGLPPHRRPAAMLLAVEAFETSPTPHARGALAALAPEGGYLDTLSPSGDVLSRVAFHPDGDLLAAGASGEVILWDAARRTHEATLPAPTDAITEAIAFSPDGRLLAAGLQNGTIALWDVASRTLTGTLRSDQGLLDSLAFSPDGTTLVSGHNSGRLVLWDPAEQTRLATLNAGVLSEDQVGDLDFSPDNVTGLAFSPDGEILASGTASGALMLWDPADQSSLATLREGAPADRGVGESDPVEALSFSPDGTTLAVLQPTPVPGDPGGADTDEVAEYPVALWDVQRRAVSATIGTRDLVSTLAYSPGGETLAMGVGEGAVLWDLSNGVDGSAPRQRYTGGSVESLGFSPDGRTLAVAAGGSAVTLLDPSSPQVVTGGDVYRLAVSGDGRRLATAGGASSIDMWDAASREHLASFDDPGYVLGGMAFSPSGEWLARAGWDVMVLHHVPREQEHRAWKTLDRPVTSRAPIAGGPQSVGFSAEPLRAFVADSYHEKLLVWPPGRSPLEKSIPGLRTAALSPGDDVLATATTSGVTLWNFPDLTEPDEIISFERPDTAPLVAFSDDGSTLVTAVRNVVTLWDVAERTRIRSFTEDFTPTGIALAADNRTVALRHEERLTVWDTVGRVRFADLPLRPSVWGDVAFLSGGTVIAATDGDTVRFWDLDAERASIRICSTLGRNLTREQWAELLPDQPYRATCDS